MPEPENGTDAKALRAMLAQAEVLWRTMPDRRHDRVSLELMSLLRCVDLGRVWLVKLTHILLACLSAAELCVLQTLLDDEIEVHEGRGDQVK